MARNVQVKIVPSDFFSVARWEYFPTVLQMLQVAGLVAIWFEPIWLGRGQRTASPAKLKNQTSPNPFR